MLYCNSTWDRKNALLGVNSIPQGAALLGPDGAKLIAEPCPNCGESFELYSALHPGTCFIQCEKCLYIGPEVKPQPTPEHATPATAWMAWNANSIANRCRKLYLHLENNGRTNGDDLGLARHYQDRLGSRDGNFSHKQLMDAAKLLAKHGF